jgi:hypothetical protein
MPSIACRGAFYIFIAHIHGVLYPFNSFTALQQAGRVRDMTSLYKIDSFKSAGRVFLSSDFSVIISHSN